MNPLEGRDIFCQFESEFISVEIFVRSLTRIAKLKVDSIREELIKDSNSFTFPQNFEIIPFIGLGEAAAVTLKIRAQIHLAELFRTSEIELRSFFPSR